MFDYDGVQDEHKEQSIANRQEVEHNYIHPGYDEQDW